jgi:nucleoside-diphosphate-sugar epimerase
MAVLGGSTFIGRAVVDAACADGWTVAVVNRGKTSGDPLPDGVEQIVADRRSHASMVDAFATRSFDAVVDVSAFVQVAGGTDYEGLVELLDGRVGRYVLVSSIMAYDQGQKVRHWHEDAPVNPDAATTYGGFKAWAERVALERCAATGFPAVAIRPAAVYGPRNNIYDMEAAMFVRVSEHLPVLVPHGGAVVGSYGHVEDLCRGVVLAATQEAAVGEVVNVTTSDVSTLDYVHTLASIVGVEAEIVMVPDDVVARVQPGWGHLFGTSHHATLDVTKATDVLGLVPRFDFRVGHEHTWEWAQASGLLDRAKEGSMVDPLWRATWDLEHEASVAAMVRG